MNQKNKGAAIDKPLFVDQGCIEMPKIGLDIGSSLTPEMGDPISDVNFRDGTSELGHLCPILLLPLRILVTATIEVNRFTSLSR